MQTGITLYELNSSIKATIEHSLPSAFWVIAEISEFNINRTGHCYLELIEKNKEGTQTIAKARATIWANTFRLLKPYFETSTGHTLSSGLKVLLQVSVTYHELYGLSLNVKDIEPAFTIGDIEKRKKEILAKLEKEGVLQMNKELVFPDVPQKIAIISSDTAAGYGDFVNQLENNPYSYKFYHKLFPASMQGENTELSITDALDKIFAYENFFDVVVIIRGGGSKSDLNSFDNYWLAYHITQFPIPVITGIGHERDDTIVDMVAHTRCKTPTAVAEFLIEKLVAFENHIDEIKEDFIGIAEEMIDDKKNTLNELALQLSPLISDVLTNSKIKLENISGKTKFTSNTFLDAKKYESKKILTDIKTHSLSLITNQRHHLQMLGLSTKSNTKEFLQSALNELNILNTFNESMAIEKTLKRGYSITLKNGKILKNTNNITTGDILESVLYNGKITSSVIKKQNQ